MADDTRTVDERVVEMQIDNKRFEAGASKTIRTLEKLEKALNIKADDKKLDAINESVSRFDASPMTKGLDAISVKMSALEVAGMRVIQNITDGIYSKVARAVKELSVGQIQAGYDKYEKMIESTQTIMAATRDQVGAGKRWETEEDQMADVNRQLEKMMFLADETSYSFTALTDAAGQFLSGGVDYDSAFTSAIGIAMAGGLAGVKPGKITQVLPQFAQAISSGAMRLQDWMSIERAGLATKEYKETYLAVAEELGQLHKVMYEDDPNRIGYTTITDAERYDELGYIKQMSEAEEAAIITSENFRTTLAQGWLNSDVLAEVNRRYGAFAEQIEKVYSETDLEVTDILELLSKLRKEAEDPIKNKVDWDYYAENLNQNGEELRALIQSLDDVGIAYSEAGYIASRESKTFTDAWEATKDAVSSKWLNTFKIIIGDYKQAVELWTDVADELYGIFAASGDIRNSILEAWNQVDEDGFTGRDYLLGKTDEFQGAFWDLIDAIHAFTDPISEAFADVFGLNQNQIEDTGYKLRDFTKRFKEFTAQLKLSDEAQAGLRNIFKVIFSGVKLATKAVGGIIPIISSVAMLIGIIIDNIMAISSGNFDSKVFFANISNGFKAIVPSVDQFKNGLKNLGKFLINLIPSEEDFVKFFNTISKLASLAWTKIKQFFSFENLKANLPTLEDINAVLDKIGIFLEDKYPTLGKWFRSFRENSFILQTFTNILDLLLNANNGFSTLFGGIKLNTSEAQSVLDKFIKVIEYIFIGLFGSPEEIKNRVLLFMNTIWSALNEFTSNITLTDIIKTLGLSGLVYVINEIALTIKQFKEIEKSASTIGESISSMLNNFGFAAKNLGKSFKSNAFLKLASSLLLISVAIGIISISLYKLSSIDGDSLMHGAATLIIVLAVIIKLCKSLSNSKLDEDHSIYNIFKSITKLSIFFVALGISISLISKAIEKITSINNIKSLWNSVGIIASILVIMFLIVSGMYTIISKLSNNRMTKIGNTLIKVAGSMIIIAFAVRLLVKPIINLAETASSLGAQSNKLWMALGIISVLSIIIAGILVAIIALMSKIDKNKISKIGNSLIKIAASMIIVAFAINLLVRPIINLAETASSLGTQSNKLWMALGVVSILSIIITGIVVTIIALMSKIDNNKIFTIGNTLIKIAISMIVVVIAIRSIMTQITSLANILSDSTILKNIILAIGLLSAVIVVIGLFTVLLGKFAGNNIIKTAASMLIIALAINLLVPAIKSFINIAASIISLTKSLDNFGSVIAKLAIAAVVFTVISIAMSLFGKGILKVGAGILLLVVGLTLLSIILVPLSVAFSLFIEALVETSNNAEKIKVKPLLAIGAAFGLIGLSIFAITKALKKSNDTPSNLGKFASKLVSGVGSIFSKLGIKIVDALPGLLKMIGAILVIGGLYALKMIPTLTNILVRGLYVLLESINVTLSANKANFEHAVFGIVATIIEMFIDGVLWGGGVLVSLIAELLAGLVESIFNELHIDINNHPFFKGMVDGFRDMETTLMNNWQQGSQNRHDMLQSWIPDKQDWTNAADSMSDIIETDVAETTKAAYQQLGEGATDTLAATISSDESKAEVIGATAEVVTSPSRDTDFLSTVKENFNATGAYTVDGLAQGALDNAPTFGNAMVSVADLGRNSFAERLGISSPSKEFAKLSYYNILGLVKGVDDNSSLVTTSMTGLGGMMLDAMARSMAQVAYIANNDFDISPRITPVVDLSNVNSAAGYMNGAFGNSYSVSAAMSNSLNRRLSEAERLATAVSDARASQQIMGDNIEINVYPSPGQNSEEIANDVISKINDRLIRRGVAFG